MLQRKENIILKKTEAFADRVIKMHNYLKYSKHRDSDILKQILRSGTSIGANTAESRFAQSEADFVSKLSIALKEANETRYWLQRLKGGGYITEAEFNSMLKDNEEIISILVKITGTMKRKLQK